jgi:hypothetical protein
VTDARTEIVEATTRMAVLTDGRRWDELPGVFAPNVRLDYSALLGGAPFELAAGDVASMWAKALGPLTTQHLVTNHLVDIAGDTATVTASFQATHVSTPGTTPWVVGGDYRYELAHVDGRWLIGAVTLTPRWETGDRSILDPPS